ncbi:MAG: hypothetical protein KKF46_04165 [Nanoarchaeota archaeon]|nr:hypothetical protein [Nanoarchaeota archaeon]MBU1321530.1 hypothetical protein [Nanoarchaeota archaeon]MBU1597160.1 hypothetical protein [Nanoarchaeota archaeon]MBU2441155.1 hypothetical protein [Nanoarchaeota archaeon]
MDLNIIVQEYKISKEGGESEFRTLKNRLSDVPVDLSKFEERLESYGCGFNDMIIRAELYDPRMRLPLLDELVDFEEADAIVSEIILPHPIIYLQGESISESFYEHNKNKLGEMILPDKKDATAQVLSSIECDGAAILYKKNENMHYVEMILTKEFL